MLGEVWKEVTDFSDYEVSSLGSIRSVDRWVNAKLGSMKFIKGRLMKPKVSKDGSLRVGIWGNGTQYYFFIHKIVAIAFIVNQENKDCVIHLDRNNKNNHVTNLSWATWDEVQEIAQLSQKLSGKTRRLNNHRSRKVTMVKEDGTEIEFNSVSEAGRNNNMDIGNINRAVNKHYKKAYGFDWK